MSFVHSAHMIVHPKEMEWWMDACIGGNFRLIFNFVADCVLWMVMMIMVVVVMVVMMDGC